MTITASAVEQGTAPAPTDVALNTLPTTATASAYGIALDIAIELAPYILTPRATFYCHLSDTVRRPDTAAEIIYHTLRKWSLVDVYSRVDLGAHREEVAQRAIEALDKAGRFTLTTRCRYPSVSAWLDD